MAIRTHRASRHRGLRATALAGGAGAILLALSSCATQEQYDEAVSQAKYYQTRLHELERDNSRLQEELDRLRSRMASGQVSALESGYPTEVGARLSELQARLDGLGRPPQDIERFDVPGGYVLMVQDKILFESGSADVSSAGLQTIGKLARDIQGQPHGRVWVRGHTDSDPVAKPQTKQRFPHGNLQLSAARAIEVAAALVKSGVTERDVAVIGFGPHEPLRPNDSGDNKRQNRRVEIFVADAGT